MFYYLSMPRLDPKKNKYQSSQHPAKKGFQEQLVEETGAQHEHPITYSFKRISKAMPNQSSPLHKIQIKVLWGVEY